MRFASNVWSERFLRIIDNDFLETILLHILNVTTINNKHKNKSLKFKLLTVGIDVDM